MKKHYPFFSLATLFLAAAMCITGCSKENIDEPDPVDPGSDPTTEVADPEGTITISMRNDKNTYLDNEFYIDDADNFSGGYFVSLGEMKGLGNVTRIPRKGWSSKIAVVPNTGLVAYNYDNQKFYRIYVKNYTVNVANEIIGADIKYQTPFYPSEKITLPLTSLSFSNEYGSQNIIFNNTNIVPFSVSSSTDWCRVQKSSTLDYSFLADGIVISVDENLSPQREAVVTISDGNDNTQEIKVIQAGADPIMSLSQDTLTMSYNEVEPAYVWLFTNYSLDQLTVTSGADWCEAELSNTEILSAMNQRLRYKGETEVTDKSNYGTGSYMLTVGVNSQNNSNNARSTTVTISSLDGTCSTQLKVTQNAFVPYIEIEEDEVILDYSEQDKVIMVNSNYAIEDLSVTSDVGWCNCSLASTIDEHVYYLTVSTNMNETGNNRSAKISVKSKDGKEQDEVNIIQNPFDFALSQDDVSFDRTSNNITIELSIDGSQVTVTNNSDWLTYSWNGSLLTLRVTENTTNQDRIAQITLTAAGSSKLFTIYQSRYAVGDSYAVGAVQGTVGILTGQNHGKIYQHLPGTYAWSTESVLTGANSTTDGEYNMNIITQIPGYETLYPAFYVVNQLNSNGVTGWYLPAYDEQREMTIPTLYYNLLLSAKTFQ